MQVRLKSFGPGDEVRLHHCVSYPLPHGIEEGWRARVIERETGSVLVETHGVRFWVSMTNVDPGEEKLLNGVWLDRWDRRVRKAEARLRQIQAQRRMDVSGRM